MSALPAFALSFTCPTHEGSYTRRLFAATRLK